MLVVDAQVHISHRKVPFSEDDLLREMTAVGVDRVGGALCEWLEWRLPG